ncbi:MAG: BatA and WFA domain-containing protein [Candidatus Nanoarchaeia archaeon]|nr:BatA and WFA domain-containing protein [Candidatus Nanoarchaeia archaeon]
MASFGITNPLGWYAFLSLIPLVILYLIRPRPKEMSIPSLMFFMQTTGADKRKSFLRNFIKDPLFLLQLLLLSLLSLFLLGPYTWVSADVISDNVAIVIDVSASSQVKELGNTRFDLAMSEAERLLGSKNTIVLARSAPEILLKDGNKGEAQDRLRMLKVSDERSKIGESILLAGEVLGNKGKVFVLSDFKNTEGADPVIAANALRSRGLSVEFIDLSGTSKKNNVGIIDLDVEDESTTVFVKNFDQKDKTINLKIEGTTKQIYIQSESVEPFSFKTPNGITKLEILEKDDFLVDNVAYVSAPEDRTIKVLLITNSESVFLKSALTSASYVTLEIAEPPIIPSGDYDVYVVDNVDPNSIITGTFSEIEQKVSAGANLIINAQPNMGRISYQNLLPVKILSERGKAVLNVEQATMFTRDVEFGRVDKYFGAESKDEAITVISAEGAPVISFSRLGSGNVLYYGIMDEGGDFKLSPYYPIYWINSLKFLTNQDDISLLNVRTGDSLILEENQNIRTPEGIIDSGAFVFDQIGVYTIGNRKIAANLISEKESNINLGGEEKKNVQEIKIEKGKENVPKNLEMELLTIIAVLLFLEILYIKTRGDL